MIEEQQNQETEVETGMLGGTTEEDFNKPSQEEDQQTVDVFEEPKEDKPVTVERPDGLPNEFWDEDAGAFKSDELFKEYKKEKDIALGLRQKLSKGVSKPPESADGYQIDHDKLADDIGIEISEDDAGLKIFRDVAFENGLDQEKFESIVKGYLEASKNSDLLQAPKEQTEEEQKAYVQSEMKKLGDDGAGVIQGIKNWNQQLYYDGLLNKEDFETAQNMGLNANEIRVINIYRRASGDLTIPNNIKATDGAETQEDINKIMSSPDYESDGVLQKKVTDFFEKKYR